MAILPIYLYGHPVLRAPARPVEEDSPELQRLIDDMLETMYQASGIGLAAPQVGHSLRLFVMDLAQPQEEEEEGGRIRRPGRPEVLLNPQLIASSEVEVEYEEGCLSIPEVREPIWRPETIRVRYQDRYFRWHEEEITGLRARVFQHEHDHLEGILLIDRISAFRRRLLRRRLNEIAQGQVQVDYLLAPPFLPREAVR
ncbi:MAG: peptide deformylase [Bacteroidetes bacterium]|nr:peptide deformylase [Rhodothermia bacterium]MCS7155388.1 peptide deformylase [Bacteroidota bacterium]MCX7907519.1 peptide deformylase [Bacteroidota bacterium]MDW8138513.1 peptide deformylase [Bacteroidota bacterium]MDW8284550.1 peptide deformylase [Bacteroidota bacterium]